MAIIAVKAKNEHISQDFFGLKSLSKIAKATHRPRVISTKTLKAKFFPVIYGKNILFATKSGTNGTAKIQVQSPQRKIFLKMFINEIITEKHKKLNLASTSQKL